MHVRDIADIPSGVCVATDRHSFGVDVLIERGVAIKHLSHIDRAGCVPLADVLVEVHRLKHGLESGHVADIPIANVLIECLGARKRHESISDTADIPSRIGGAPDRHCFGADVLVEVLSTSKGILKVVHVAGVPVADVLIEIGCSPEHINHGSVVADIPSDVFVDCACIDNFGADVLIELVSEVKQARHVVHGAGIPATDVLVKIGEAE